MAGDDAADVRWVPVDDAGLVAAGRAPGCVDFLAEHRSCLALAALSTAAAASR